MASSYNNMAYVYKAKKDLAKAKEYWEKAYAIFPRNWAQTIQIPSS